VTLSTAMPKNDVAWAILGMNVFQMWVASVVAWPADRTAMSAVMVTEPLSARERIRDESLLSTTVMSDSWYPRKEPAMRCTK
jgi:hypothetical protein